MIERHGRKYADATAAADWKDAAADRIKILCIADRFEIIPAPNALRRNLDRESCAGTRRYEGQRAGQRRAANRGHGRVGSGKIDAHRKAERWRRARPVRGCGGGSAFHARATRAVDLEDSDFSTLIVECAWRGLRRDWRPIAYKSGSAHNEQIMSRFPATADIARRTQQSRERTINVRVETENRGSFPTSSH